MPGSYAHMIAVNLAGDRKSMTEYGFPLEAINWMAKFKKYAELGAVSPDLPYLAGAKKWADLMHYTQTGMMIDVGLRKLCELPKDSRGREYAWLLGYAAHVVADVTIHPVVFLKVGPYEENSADHRWCEINQDVHIYRRMNLGEVNAFLKSGIRACKVEAQQPSPGIAAFWGSVLNEVHPEPFAADPPDIAKWHERFGFFLDKADSGPDMPAFSRHAINHLSPSFYPKLDEVEAEFVKGLKVPGGQRKDYDEIFDEALSNIKSMWLKIALAVEANDPDADLLTCAWNLDTGEEPDGAKTYWKEDGVA